MIVKSYIKKTLDTLNRRYLASATKMGPLYYSKLAVLELCGWIEISIDDLALRAVRKKVRDRRKCERFEKAAIRPINGFHYKRDFRRILCSAIGEIIVANIEQKMDSIKLARLESELNTLQKSRNRLAHTYVKGVTQQIDAPSRTIRRFNLIYDGLKEFEKEILTRI